jgi:hypothetical protein
MGQESAVSSALSQAAMENEFGIDLEGIMKVVDAAEVIVVRFQVIEPRLLIDTRFNDLDGPLICLVPRAGSAEERFRSLKRMRPRFALPDRIMSFQWPRHVATLETSGVWARIYGRIAASGSREALARCDAVFRELLEAERELTLTAVRGGDGFETIWKRGR